VHKLAFLLMMFAMSATAADFRALDIGQSCASAREWEVARGSTPMPGRTGAAGNPYHGVSPNSDSGGDGRHAYHLGKRGSAGSAEAELSAPRLVACR
jgi:hypothetical protein